MADPPVIANGFVAVGADGLIAEVGLMTALRPGAETQAALVIDARGRAVLPGFVDPHTHIVYGGDRTHEFKLRIAGAGYAAIAQAFVRLLIEEMLPAIAQSGLTRFNDVFCEEGVFSREQSRRILLAGKALGLKPKIHADELAAGFGGAEVGADVGERVGSLEPGKQADMLILSEPSHEAIPYRFGSNLVDAVIKRGRLVVQAGRRIHSEEDRSA